MSRKDFERNNRVHQLRKELGLNQNEFALLTGMNFRSVSDIENHKCGVSKMQANRISNGARVGVEWILYGDESKKEYPVNDRLVKWLWEHEDIRAQLWKAIQD